MWEYFIFQINFGFLWFKSFENQSYFLKVRFHFAWQGLASFLSEMQNVTVAKRMCDSSLDFWHNLVKTELKHWQTPCGIRVTWTALNFTEIMIMGTMIIGSKLCSLMAAFQLNCPSAQKRTLCWANFWSQFIWSQFK